MSMTIRLFASRCLYKQKRGVWEGLGLSNPDKSQPKQIQNIYPKMRKFWKFSPEKTQKIPNKTQDIQKYGIFGIFRLLEFLEKLEKFA
jgi:hypothetical protein